MDTASTRRAFCELGAAALLAKLSGCGGAAPGGGGGDGDGSGGSTTATAEDTTAATSDGSSGVGGGSSGSDATTDASDGSSDATSSDTSGASSSSTDGTDGSTGGVVCEPSPGSIEGPYYRPGMPVRSELDLYGDDGVPIHLSGQVVDGTCTPVVAAIVELWHASPGAPRAVPGDEDASYDASQEFRYYGQVATDAEGRYSISTLKPGWYLNGDSYRPAHFHVKIWVRDVEVLTTQLYFEGDPFNDADPWYDPTMELAPDDDGNVTRDFAV
ncbi:MAG: hypothetical protein U0168_01385 [Nannocystaceae bacterium]